MGNCSDECFDLTSRLAHALRTVLDGTQVIRPEELLAMAHAALAQYDHEVALRQE